LVAAVMSRSFHRVGLCGPALFLLAVGVLLNGCAHRASFSTAGSGTHAPSRAVQLTAALTALDPSVDVHDAAMLATVAIQTSSELALSYRARPPAWLHNIYVNNGWRERGLCWHWAEDLQARLGQEHFATLEIHRVVARRGTRREHSGVAVTARGQDVTRGLVLDAWRECGRLVWVPFVADKYPWAKMPEEK
jgi:hypothetical protein